MPPADAPRPNILIVMTDQQRADTVPPRSRAVTPKLEAFAKRSHVFTNAHTVSPHCSPSRASFFTSLYPSQHRLRNNPLNGQALSQDLKPEAKLWSQGLSKAGYALHFTGKWHVSKNRDPRDFGWEEHDAIRLGSASENREATWDLIGKTKAERSQAPGSIKRKGYSDWTAYGASNGADIDDELSQVAADQIQNLAHSDRPWCYYVGFIGPHDPYKVPQRFLDLYPENTVDLPKSYHDDLSDKPNIYRRTREQIWDQLSPAESKESLRHYLAYCSKMDEHFGQILDALDESGQRKNTIVVFLSDHGDYAGDHGLWCKGIAAFEGAYRIPLMISIPENKPQTIDAFTSICDIGPTLLEAVGIEYSKNEYAGRSLLPLLDQSETQLAWRDSICYQCDGVELYYTQRAIVTRQWKYVFNGFDYDELYDLVNDPDEQNNLARQEGSQTIIQDLCARLWKFAKSVDDTPISEYITVALAPIGPRAARSFDSNNKR
ncbi:MAG: sulfatase-like hydrolase/transferase [Verrucomicrobiota bacterium]